MKHIWKWPVGLCLGVFAGCDSQELVHLDVKRLHVRAPGRDDPGLGPNAFDIDPQGGIIVSDPVAERIVFFTADGRFRSALPLGFAADRVRRLDNGTFVVRRAVTGQFYVARPGSPAQVVSGPMLPSRPLLPQVQIQSQAERLVGVQWVADDERSARYVVLEIATPGPSIQIRRVVRKYNRAGRLIQEQALADGPALDTGQDVCVRGDRIYQLLVNGKRIQVARWGVSPI